MRTTLRARTAALMLAAGLLLPGCASPGGKAGASQARLLADTRWRLVEIQSMDDSVGAKRPADPSHYTMSLKGDGAVSMKLNCNSATGSWSVEPGADAASGRFQFGPLAATRALCPPPSLDEEIVAQAQYVRSFLLKDGRLHLSLMADGGIYVWEPYKQEESSQSKADPEIEKAILRASPSYTRAVVDQAGGTGRGRYAYSRVDLNGDGKEEVLVYLMGSIFCGTGGCNLQLFTSGPDGYSLINEFSISRLPVIVSPAKTGGWNDLWRLESGGGAPRTYVRHTFDGKKYKVRQRVPADKPPEGASYLAGEITFEKGIPLAPRE